jgi:aminoglycoside phosphotransferase (APT) family kinase protein
VNQRGSDRYLDQQIVSGLIASQFPGLAGQQVTRLGCGWDHDLFLVGGEWIVRFPRRAERVAWLTREVEILGLAAPVLGPLAPVIELIGTPTETFPYPFLGYRRLPGVGADQTRACGPAARAALAGDIAALLSALHRVDPGQVPPTPEGWEHQPWGALRTELAAVGERARPWLGGELLARAEPYLAGQVPEPARDGSRRFIHNDICPDHLLVDPDTGRLTGLIDFTDAMVGDPVLDFTGLIGIGGYRFIGQVAARYDLPLDDGFGARLEWLARVLTLTWLAEAAADNPWYIPKHRSWVARAFQSAAR